LKREVLLIHHVPGEKARSAAGVERRWSRSKGGNGGDGREVAVEEADASASAQREEEGEGALKPGAEELAGAFGS
jgi:hypothetical protein